MENALQEIMSSEIKHKEQVAIMTKMAIADKKVLSELFEILRTGTDVHKGTAAEVMKFVSKDAARLDGALH